MLSERCILDNSQRKHWLFHRNRGILSQPNNFLRLKRVDSIQSDLPSSLCAPAFQNGIMEAEPIRNRRCERVRIVVVYLLIINIAAYFVMRRDKRLARQGGRRIPEKTLFGYAAFGGAAGIWLGMRAFRHKTKHLSFLLGVPALFAVNIGCVWYLATFLA